jgi:hypothetical protein
VAGIDQRDHAGARGLLAESLAIARELGDSRVVIDGRETCAYLALAVGRTDRTARLQYDWRKPRFIATVPGKGYRFIPTFSDFEHASETIAQSAQILAAATATSGTRPGSV